MWVRRLARAPRFICHPIGHDPQYQLVPRWAVLLEVTPLVPCRWVPASFMGVAYYPGFDTQLLARWPLHWPLRAIAWLWGRRWFPVYVLVVLGLMEIQPEGGYFSDARWSNMPPTASDYDRLHADRVQPFQWWLDGQEARWAKMGIAMRRTL